MPVKIETSEFEEEMLDMLFLDEPITEPLLSDDIWKKFELDFPEFSGIADIFFQEEQTLFHDSQDIEVQQGCMFHSSNSSGNAGAGALSCSPPTSANEIRHHDCMWAGHCGSKEHDDRPNGGGCFLVPDPLTIRRPPPPPPPKAVAIKKEEPDDTHQYQQPQYQQQPATRSVLKPAVRAAVKQQQQQQQQQHMPQTPPMSDDEEGKTKPC
nr:unnamed protein product [Callosobruchus analis]